MRSSIACARCRRSKIKCVNAGIDTTCRACESSGRECVYPTPAMGVGAAAAAAAVKRDINSLADPDDRNGGDWEGIKRQRPRKSMAAVSANRDSGKANGMVLDSALLTVKVWESLFDLFQLHFSATLPFLHPTTFLAQIRQPSNPNTLHADGQPPNDRSQSPAPTGASPLILLGILSLTARFHPQLVQHHSPSSSMNPSNPLVASEFYADALRSRLTGADGADVASVGIDRVQALLMLGLHEWGMCRGKSAWAYVGMAIRMAQGMGLGFESESDTPTPRPSISNSTPSNMDHRDDRRDHNSDDVIDQEARRRTFWACFMLDRCVSSGKYRPRMIRVRDMDIQLPSDNAFAFGERVRTSRLNNNGSTADRRRSQGYDSRGNPIPTSGFRQSTGYPDDSKMRPSSGGMTADSKHWSTSSHRSDGLENGIDRWEVGAEEGVLGRLIRMFRVWGNIAKWSCAGGRKVDRHQPWHPESRFSHLRELLIEFQDGLSRNLRYSPRNTDTHIMYKNTLAPYSLMHIVYFLSVIVLHRAYLPFLPTRSSEPTGPLDDSSPYLVDRYNAPDGFWRDSAREVFKAARQMMELVRVCRDRGVLMEIPLVGFAVYNAAFMGVYAAHFSHMDQEAYVCSKPNSTEVIPGSNGQQSDVRRAVEILGEMRPRLKMAGGWFRTIHRLHGYYSRINNRDHRVGSRSRVDHNELAVNGRSPGLGVNRDDLKSLDRIFSELGSGEDQASPEVNGIDENVTSGLGAGAAEHGGGATSDSASNAVKSESGNDLDSHTDGAGPRRESWVPVNSPGRGLFGKEGADHPPRTSDLGPMHHRSIENDRWPSLPPPPQTTPGHSYSLPSIQPPPQHHGPSTPNTLQPPPPRSISPGPGAGPGPYNSHTVSSTLPPYLPTSSPSSNKLQPLQSWQSSRSQPPHSQSLPSLSAAAQHGFAMPPLPPASTLHNNTSGAPNTHPHHSLASPPPSGSRFEPAGRAIAPPTGGVDLPQTQASNSGCLGGDDVIAFVVGESCENWAATASAAGAGASVNVPQVGGVVCGWLGVVWGKV